MMEEVRKGSLDYVSRTKEILRLEQAKQTLENLNSDLEKDMQNLDEANQSLLVQIREKELKIQSLEKEITKSIDLAGERDEINRTASEREDALKDLELETTKLEKSNEILAKSVNELRIKLSRKPPQKIEVEKESLKQMLDESKEKLQKATAFCAEQEKELAKKYQEILRLMEEDREILLLETEVNKAQSLYNQTGKPPLILAEVMEEKLFKEWQRHLWFSISLLIFLMILFLTRVLSFGFLYLHFINPDFLLNNLPKIMDRNTLWRLRGFLLPSLNLRVEDFLPH
uniref:Transmembrane and coiled-coil domain-containing protein 5B-like n=1 Tax=Monodelphis domestica TaxID=13616 RepID=A0A5F8HB89_MONDO